ncbi:MAG: hypothetical protein ABW318_20510 [Vicinamibacterales bacterium]
MTQKRLAGTFRFAWTCGEMKRVARFSDLKGFDDGLRDSMPPERH